MILSTAFLWRSRTHGNLLRVSVLGGWIKILKFDVLSDIVPCQTGATLFYVRSLKGSYS